MSMGFSPVSAQFFHRRGSWLAVKAANLWETPQTFASCFAGFYGHDADSRSGPSAQSRNGCLDGD
jgi:hypothetical protein